MEQHRWAEGRGVPAIWFGSNEIWICSANVSGDQTLNVSGFVPIFVRPSPSSSGLPIFVRPSPSSSGCPHLRPAVPIFVRPSPSSSNRTTHIVRSVRPDPPDPPDLTGLCFILFMNSRMFSFHNTMSLRQPNPFLTLWKDLQPHRVVGLLLILSHGLSYASIMLLYLVLSILLDYILTSDLCP